MLNYNEKSYSHLQESSITKSFIISCTNHRIIWLFKAPSSDTFSNLYLINRGGKYKITRRFYMEYLFIQSNITRKYKFSYLYKYSTIFC